MSERQTISEEVVRLTWALLDGLASDEERQRLGELLQGDPEACELYLDLVEQHTATARQIEGNTLIDLGGEGVLPFSEVPQARPRGMDWGLLAAALVALLCVAGIVVLSRYDDAAEIAMAQGGVAVVSQVVDTDGSYTVGDVLQPGSFQLDEGFAQLEFFCGATVVVEGPAELDIESMWLATCHRGKLRISVPEPAQGFSIETSGYRAVDLGTEFALSVDERGASEILVLDGEVRIDELSGEALQTLTGGDGLRLEHGSGEFQEPNAGGGDFIGHEVLQTMVSRHFRDDYRVWRSHRDQLREHPDLVQYFDFEFEDRWQRNLPNVADSGAVGAIIGAQWTSGRWPRKGALEFSRITDRVRLAIPGEYDQMTLVASINVRSFDRWLSSLILTDGWDEGEVHWQISDLGEVIAGVRGPPSSNTFSPAEISNADLGKWLQVATTIDRIKQETCHYLDGRLIVRQSIPAVPKLRFGHCEIGNWQDQGNGHPIRSFNGKIDEFMIFSRVLSQDEISDLIIQ